MTRRVVVVPGAPALLPEYSGIADPVADLRKACLEAVSWLVDRSPRVRVLGDGPDPANVARGVHGSLAERIGASLLAEAGFAGGMGDDGGLLVVANGSARRGEKAPGHLDDRAFAFDAAIETALAGGDAVALGRIDRDLGRDLLASGLDALGSMAGLTCEEATMIYAEEPFGVRYWVVTWSCAS